MDNDTARGVPKRLGHVALRVRDVERATAFYSNVLGLSVRSQHPGIAFLGVREDSSHELALFEVGKDAPGPEDGRVGMYHMAWEMPSFAELERLHERLLASGVDIGGYSDRQCNVMFCDPDGNELEAIWEPSAEELEALSGQPLPRLKG